MTKPARCGQPLAVMALAMGLLAPAAGRAQAADDQRARAEVLYKLATAEMDAKVYASACSKLEEVTRLVPDGLGAKLTLGKCYEGLRKFASAWFQYTLVEQMAERSDPTGRLREARVSAATLLPWLSTLVIEVPNDVRSIPGLVLTRDGIPVGEAQWGTPQPVDVGEYEIVATAPGRRPWRGKIEILADGLEESLTVKPPDEPPDERPTAEPEAALPAPFVAPTPERKSKRTLGIGAMGVGGASIVLGAVLGGLAIAKNGDSNEDNHCDARDLCDATGLELRRQAVALGNGSTAAVVLGSVVLAGGAVVLAMPQLFEEGKERAGVKRRGIQVGIELTPGFVRVKGGW